MNFVDMPQSKEDTVRIRPIEVGDLDALFEMHVDPESNAMAVTIPRTQEAFYEHWHRSLQQDNITPRAILLDETFVGCISSLPDRRKNEPRLLDRPKTLGKRNCNTRCQVDIGGMRCSADSRDCRYKQCRFDSHPGEKWISASVRTLCSGHRSLSGVRRSLISPRLNGTTS